MLHQMWLYFLTCSFHILPTVSDISKCKYQRSTYNCSGVGLQSIPDGRYLPPGLKILDLSNNNITRIPFLNFSESVSSSLIQMFLNHNQINSIQNFSFSKLTNLETLDMSFNSLSGLDVNYAIFANMSSLQNLFLDQNPLRIVRRLTFTELEIPVLRFLSLAHCELIDLENSAIGFNTLNALHLSGNRLNSISIKDLPIIVLEDFNTLDLSYNEIEELNNFNFPSVIGLRNLILDHNRITRLSLINVSFYQIQSISLRYNNVRTLDNTSLPWYLTTLRYIDFRENPIVCDCNMSWMLEDPKLKTKTVRIMCESPPVLNGRNLLDLKLSDLNCTDPRGYHNHHDDLNIVPIVIGIVLASGVLLVVTGILTYMIRKRQLKENSTSSSTKSYGSLAINSSKYPSKS
ncbi:hypothetical protein CHS0354_013886 [Potamilus streckersoni]|uniref:LRRCT domain-containing protein n=1 Tax=Potamilus streckersoni TaxID=2493646 RepID=A0AAE0SEY2_9BIVA|nr:hypothetical protein CHS0354_013886 [Potamilus streckersoni]